MHREGDDFVYLWRLLRVGAVLTGVREDDAGRVHAEITVLSVGPDGQRTGLLEWGQINLSSFSGREGLERGLRKRAPEGIDWGKALRWVCVKTAEAYRVGNPFVDLSTVRVLKGQKFLFHDLFPLGEVSTLYGDGSCGKSLTAMLAAVSYALGETVAGVLRPAAAGTTLYLDWETTEEEHADRLDALARGLGLRAAPPVAYRAQQRTLADDAAPIRKKIDQDGVGLVVVDSMSLACGNVLDQDAVVRFYRTLRSFPRHVTKIVVTHLSADGARQERGPASPVGLRHINNYGRSNWEMRAERVDARNQLDVAMLHRKANGFALQPPVGLRFVFDRVDGAIGVERFDVLESASLVAHSGAGDQIIALLRAEDLPAPRIAAELDLKPNVVRVHLSRLQKAGVVRHAEGRGAAWTLVRGVG
jgi:DNA-binding CsgD family transcriptional regulator